MEADKLFLACISKLYQVRVEGRNGTRFFLFFIVLRRKLKLMAELSKLNSCLFFLDIQHVIIALNNSYLSYKSGSERGHYN